MDRVRQTEDIDRAVSAARLTRDRAADERDAALARVKDMKVGVERTNQRLAAEKMLSEAERELARVTVALDAVMYAERTLAGIEPDLAKEIAKCERLSAELEVRTAIASEAKDRLEHARELARQAQQLAQTSSQKRKAEMEAAKVAAEQRAHAARDVSAAEQRLTQLKGEVTTEEGRVEEATRALASAQARCVFANLLAKERAAVALVGSADGGLDPIQWTV
jgi:hypothetical protein